MGNRKQPFGYKMSLGEIIIQEAEAKLVQEIFRRYIEGGSLNELTEALRHQDMCPLGKGCCGGCGGVLKRTVPRYGRLLSPQCPPNAGFLADVQ